MKAHIWPIMSYGAYGILGYRPWSSLVDVGKEHYRPNIFLTTCKKLLLFCKIVWKERKWAKRGRGLPIFKEKVNEHSLGPMLSKYFCCNWTAIKLWQDFDAFCEMLSRFSSGHICACYQVLGHYHLDGANLQTIETHLVPKIMHQNLAVILHQFNYGKNSFIVLVPGFIWRGEGSSVTRSGDLLDFGQLSNAFDNT